MVNKRKNRQKLLMTDELFDKIGHEYKEDKPNNSSIYTPVEEEDDVSEFLDLVTDFEETSETNNNKKPRGGLVLLTLFLLISLLSIATIVFILVRGGV